MSRRTELALAVSRCMDMAILRGRAAIAQHHRRRIAAADGALAWVEFRAIFGREIIEDRRALAQSIRAIRAVAIQRDRRIDQ